MEAEQKPALDYIPYTVSEMSAALRNHADKMKEYAENNFRLSRQDSEDLFGDVSVKVILMREQYNPNKAKISTWLFAVMRNTQIDSARNYTKEFHRKLVPNDREAGDDYLGVYTTMYDQPVPENDYSSDNSVEVIMAAVRSLPAPYADLLVMHINGFTYLEISDHFNRPIYTVKSQMGRAKFILAQSLLANGLLSLGELGERGVRLGRPLLPNQKLKQNQLDRHARKVAQAMRELFLKTK